MISETDESGSIFSYTYDVLGNTTSVTDGEDNVVNYTYDSNGNLASAISNGASNTYSYNSVNNISAITHNGFSYTFNYDVFRNLVSTYIGTVAISTNTYDSNNGNLIETAFANGDYIQYTYDDYDNITEITGETGTIAEFVYNKKGLVAKAIDYSSGRTTYYYYDFSGTLTGEYRQNSNGSLSYYLSYDADGNKVEKTSINGQLKTITTGTDEDGNAFVSNNGITAETETDDFGRTTQVKTSRGEGNSVYFSEYEYEILSSNNSTTNRVSKLTQRYGSSELVNYEYDYDGNGNIKQIKQDGTIVAKYTYDELNQLICAADCNSGLYTLFYYDNAGNIAYVREYNLSTTSWAPNGLISEKAYVYGDSNWKDKLTSYNGTTITYDLMGNPLSYRNGMTFTWQNGRQLASLQIGSNVVNYKYDSNGMRTQKADGTGTTDYYYDSDNNLIGLTKGEDTLLFYYDSNSNVTSFKYDNTMFYYVKNLQGDVIKIINQAGTEVVTYTYDAWGKIIKQTDSTVYNIANLNPFKYRSYVYDNESGLYYLQSRYYDPVTGRFLNIDGTQNINKNNFIINLFSYCSNNPVSYYDRTGMSWEDIKDFIRKSIHLGHTFFRDLGFDTAAMGAFFLMMAEDDNGIYHADFDCWQQYFGYNDFYDFVFDLGTSMKQAKLDFSYKDEYYIIWAWKGDYINLGAGAEIGIYVGEGPHYFVDKSQAMWMGMILTYKDKEIIHYVPDEQQWWLTGFNPNYQNVFANNLTAYLGIRFNDSGMYYAFKKRWLNDKYYLYFKDSSLIAILVF